MAKKIWRFRSEDWETISLHDCHISDICAEGGQLTLFFEKGFDVTRDNACNTTGRHRNTGPAAVILKGGRFLEGAFDRNATESVRSADGSFREIPLQERPMDEDTFLHKLDLEILSFWWERETGRLTLDCDNWADVGTPEIRTSCQITLSCDRLLFCWDDLPRDAWFQR